MGSGAYALYIDQQAGGGPAGALRRVVPLPPPEQSGGVKFTTVALSLAYDTFGDAGAPATIPAQNCRLSIDAPFIGPGS